jgi:hypothetical protein
LSSQTGQSREEGDHAIGGKLDDNPKKDHASFDHEGADHLDGKCFRNALANR